MNTYYCYELWEHLKPDFTEMFLENDEEAFDFWLKLTDEHQLRACFSLTRLVEVDGVFHEEFLAMFRRGEHGLEIIKSHAL